MPSTHRWFDGHLDLAYLAEQGRDLANSPDACGGKLQPAAATFPALRAGNVHAALATLFIQRRVRPAEARRRGEEEDDGPWCFDTLKEAGDAARRQLAIYARWQREGLIDVVSRRSKPDRLTTTPSAPPLKVVLLMEGAMGLERVEEFDEFYEAGVRVVSLTWAEGSIFSGGDHFGGDVTFLGRELIHHMDQLGGIIHDVSHLSEKSFWTVMELAKGPKIASHSNCRALLPTARYPERHLSDPQIRALVTAGGLIGINLYSNFLVDSSEKRRATLADILRHIRHMEDLTGRRDFLALGSDMDGGFSKEKLPLDLDTPDKLPRLAEALASAGWSDDQITRFTWTNWTRLLESTGIKPF